MDGRISVALATFNGERFLGAQLASLSAQTYRPFELVVTDDGSTDRTAEIVSGFAAAAPFPVRLHRNAERLGYRGNFMRCAALCAGDLIAFCDQDDLWLPHKLATQVRHFADPRVQLSCHPVRLTDPDGRPGDRVFAMLARSGTFGLTDLPPFAYTIGLTQMFRRGLLAGNALWPASSDPNLSDDRAAHDQWFFFLAAVRGGIVHAAEPLALYRQHDGNAFGAPPRPGSMFRIDADFVAERDRQYQHWLACCRNRIAVLSAMRAPECGIGAEDALRHYRHALRVLEGRLAFYGGTTPARRAAVLAANLLRGHYLRVLHPWNLGPRSIVKDVATVLLAPAPHPGPRGGT